MRQFQCVPATYVTENKKNYSVEINVYTKYHVHCLSLLKRLKLSISIKIRVIILQIVYICMTATAPNLSL